MTLLDFAKSIGQIIYIECRPNHEFIVSFGIDCQRVTEINGKREYTNAIYGRGHSIGEAVEALCCKLNSGDKRFLKFTVNFGRETTVEVPNRIEPGELL